jgi:ribonuclease Z
MSSKINIIFLGTAASIPSETRNTTSILLNYKDENILIDCGEGTQRQIRKAKLNPCNINKILITHWHGDHIFGLPGLFQTLALSGYNKKMDIFGPKKTKEFMKNFINIFIPVFKFKAEVNEIQKPGIFFENKDFYIASESMEHGIPTNTYSFVIKDKIRIDKNKLKKSKLPKGKHLSELQKGKDIIYEGKKYKAKDLTYIEKGKKISIVLDTVYNNKIEKFVKDSDILICESSFSKDLTEKAKEHMHLTSEQAGQIAKKAKVKKLILTHISQRYENNPKELLYDAKKHFKNVLVVKDFDKIEV